MGDQTAGTITFDVPYNMSEVREEVTDLGHTFIVASVPTSSIITPALGGIEDLTSPKYITITAADGSKVKYNIIAIFKNSAEAIIFAFHFAID